MTKQPVRNPFARSPTPPLGSVAAQEHVAVIDPRPLSVVALGDTVGMADATRERLNGELLASRLLLSRVPEAAAARATGARLRRDYGERVFRTVIPRNVRLAEAPSFGKPAMYHDKYSRGALAYLALAGEINRRAVAS